MGYANAIIAGCDTDLQALARMDSLAMAPLRVFRPLCESGYRSRGCEDIDIPLSGFGFEGCLSDSLWRCTFSSTVRQWHHIRSHPVLSSCR